MTHLRRFLLAACAVVPLLAVAQPASSAVISSSAPIVLVGVGASPSPIAVGTTFTPRGAFVSGDGDGAFLTLPLFTDVMMTSVTATVGSAFNFTIDGWGSFVGTANLATLGVEGSGRVVTIKAAGDFTPLAGGPVEDFEAGAAQVTFSANQTGTGVVAASFTVIWDAVEGGGGFEVPAPMSLVLFGAGLLGLGALRGFRRV
jgi:hypothetical protein